MTSTQPRTLRPYPHLPAPLRRVLEFDVAHPDLDAAAEASLAATLHLTRDTYLERLRDALTTTTTAPEDIALADIARARRSDPGPGTDEPAATERGLLVGKRIHLNGHTFTAEIDMAEIFLRHATRVFLSGNSDLVLLRHTRGLEMFPITRITPYEVTDIVCADDAEAARVRQRLGLRPRC